MNRTPRFGNAKLQDYAKGTKNNLLPNAGPSTLMEQRGESITPGRGILGVGLRNHCYIEPAVYSHFSGLLCPGAVFRFLGELSNL